MFSSPPTPPYDPTRAGDSLPPFGVVSYPPVPYDPFAPSPSPLPAQIVPSRPVSFVEPVPTPSPQPPASVLAKPRAAPPAELHMPSDMPAEILFRILRMSIQGLSPSSRYRILRSAALVARSWRDPAQRLLCRDVIIHSQTTAKLWMQSAGQDRYITERIELDGRYGQVDARAAEAVLAKAKPGLTRLRIDFVRGLSQRAFCVPNLATVTHLTLHMKLFCDAVPVEIPFQLTRLVLGGSYFPLAFTRALFSASVDSLTDLSVTMQSAHSPELQELINQCISSLNVLTTFSDWTRTSQDFVALLPYLPSSLETLNTGFPDRHRLGAIERALDLERLPHLTSLRFMYLTRDEFLASADGRRLKTACDDRGIIVTFGFEKDYLREEHLLSRTEALKIYY